MEADETVEPVVVTVVTYETFKKDPVQVLRLSDRGPVAVIDGAGKRRMYLGVVSGPPIRPVGSAVG